MTAKQGVLFEEKIEFEYLESVIGSGYEEDVGKLAIEDGVAYRAARKNMQIHSAMILKINGEFGGFFTFQVNHISKEFWELETTLPAEEQLPFLPCRIDDLASAMARAGLAVSCPLVVFGSALLVGEKGEDPSYLFRESYVRGEEP